MIILRTEAAQERNKTLTAPVPTQKSPEICRNRHTRPVVNNKLRKTVPGCHDRQVLRTHKSNCGGEGDRHYRWHHLLLRSDIVLRNTGQGADRHWYTICVYFFKPICVTLWIVPFTTMEYHPESNGQVNQSKATIVRDYFTTSKNINNNGTVS